MKILNKRYLLTMSTIVLISFLIVFLKINREKRNRIPKSATLVQIFTGDYYG